MEKLNLKKFEKLKVTTESLKEIQGGYDCTITWDTDACSKDIAPQCDELPPIDSGVRY